MFHVKVMFPEEFPVEFQGPALLSFERHLRVLSRKDVVVYKDKMKDDSKLRMAMTAEERAKV